MSLGSPCRAAPQRMRQVPSLAGSAADPPAFSVMREQLRQPGAPVALRCVQIHGAGQPAIATDQENLGAVVEGEATRGCDPLIVGVESSRCHGHITGARPTAPMMRGSKELKYAFKASGVSRSLSTETNTTFNLSPSAPEAAEHIRPVEQRCRAHVGTMREAEEHGDRLIAQELPVQAAALRVWSAAGAVPAGADAVSLLTLEPRDVGQRSDRIPF